MKQWMAVVVATGVLAACGGGQAVPPPEGVPEREVWPTEGWPAEREPLVALRPAEAELRQSYDHFSGLLVIQEGRIIYEGYFSSQASEFQRFDVRTMATTFTAAGVGLALEEGAISSLDDPIADYISGVETPITVRHLLTMQSGIEWDETAVSPLQSAIDESWVGIILEQPQVADPGTTWNYSSADGHLLSVTLSEATGEDGVTYIGDRIFDVIGINNRQWITDPQGYNHGGNGLRMRTRELARFGFLYLNRGYWDGQQVLPVEWVDASLTPQVEVTVDGEMLGYGYHWWIMEKGGYMTYAAIGKFGQYLYLVPELDLIVVIVAAQGNAPEAFEGEALFTFDFLEEFILPAVNE